MEEGFERSELQFHDPYRAPSLTVSRRERVSPIDLESGSSAHSPLFVTMLAAELDPLYGLVTGFALSITVILWAVGDDVPGIRTPHCFNLIFTNSLPKRK